MAVASLKNFELFTAKHHAFRLVCLHGDNDGLIRERASALRATFVTQGPTPSIVDLDGDTLAREPFALADELGSMSLFADRRLLRVTLGARATHEAFANALPALPMADGVLVVVDAGKDKRQEDTITLLRNDRSSLVVACPPDDLDDLGRHARRILEAGHVTVDEASARELVELTNGDRALLANEIAKILLLAERGDAFGAAAIRAAVADDAGLLLDDAADRILAGDVSAAVETTDRIAGAGGDSVQLAATALRKALWAHRNASGAKASDLRRAIARLSDVVVASRSNDKLADARAEMTLIRTAQFFRR